MAKQAAKDVKPKITGGAQRKSSKAPTGFFGTPAAILGPRLLLIASVLILCVIGLVMIYSASSITAYSSSDFGNDPAYFLKRQAIWLTLGLVLCIAMVVVPYRTWANTLVSWGFWGGTAVLLLLVIAGLGNVSLGATRSITIAGFEFQPAEFAKITVLMLVASILERYGTHQMDSRTATIQVGVVSVLTLALIVQQPDLGTTAIVFVGVVTLLFLSPVDNRIVVGVIVFLAIVFVAVCFVQPYHLDRINTVLNPWADAQGDGYQTIQGFYAFGSGGIFGTGLGLSRQKYLYLPYAYNDFIYAVIGEELGLVGAVFVVVLFGLLINAGLHIARTAPDLFGSIVAGGLTVMIGFQAVVNMACVVGIFPVTGKALPFISYGGSSLIATMLMVGIILSISWRSRLDNVSETRRENLRVVEGGRSRQSQSQQPEPQGGFGLGGVAAGIGGMFSGLGSRKGGAQQAASQPRQHQQYQRQQSQRQGRPASQDQRSRQQQGRAQRPSSDRASYDRDLDRAYRPKEPNRTSSGHKKVSYGEPSRSMRSPRSYLDDTPSTDHRSRRR